MARPRRSSNVSIGSSGRDREQELGSMYDYLAKIILLGPSGSGKFVHCLALGQSWGSYSQIIFNYKTEDPEGRILSSQTIGVEFSSKIIKVGTGSRRKRIKLQLWDTAGTERFRSVSRSYYRGAAGAILVYDLASYSSFAALPTFLNDARALASPNLTLLLAGNKSDLTSDHRPSSDLPTGQQLPPTPISPSSHEADFKTNSTSENKGTTHQRATSASEGRQVSAAIASGWASGNDIPVSVEVSAFDGTGVEELFSRLASMILTKLELGEIDPDDPMSGIQYGDAGWRGEDGMSVKSGATTISEEGGLGRRRRKGRGRAGTGGWGTVKNLQSDIADFEQEVKLAETAAERDLIDSLAEIYSIVITLDGLEKHYTKDSISENEYTDICNRLLKQYKSILKDETVAREFGDLERFKREWDMEVPRATERLRIGLPATIADAPAAQPTTHQTSSQPRSSATGQQILLATESFITFMDALKLKYYSKDTLHPLLSELIQSVNQVTETDFENRGKIISWLIRLNGMRATEELAEDEARELAFDMDGAYAGFRGTVK